MIVVYDDVAGLSEIYLTDDESMATMKKASQEQLACDIPPTKRKYFAKRDALETKRTTKNKDGKEQLNRGSWIDDAN